MARVVLLALFVFSTHSYLNDYNRLPQQQHALRSLRASLQKPTTTRAPAISPECKVCIDGASPVVWAPWLNSVWYGNAYDYRTAYFGDVMYANNVPYKEGTILPREKSSAYSLALLHQRYSRDLTGVYSVSNATLFNIASDRSIRIGRFKVPFSTNTHILSVLDPLSIDDLRSYSSSNALVKLFQKKVFQNKRKRDITFTSTDVDYFDKVIYFLEYGRYYSTQKLEAYNMTVPIHPLPDCINFSISRDRISAKMSDVNRQYFVDNFMQSLIDYTGSAYDRMIISGDGGVLHSAFASIASRIVSGNKYKHCYIVMNLTDDENKSDNGGNNNNYNNNSVEMDGRPYIKILLDIESERSLDGNFSVKIQRSKYDDEGEYVFDDLDYENIVTIMKGKSTVRLNPSPLDTACDDSEKLFGDTVIRYIYN